MALISSLGRAASSISTSKSAMTKAAILGAGVASASGFVKGLGSQDLSSGLYEMATGDPNIDQYVFGTDMGVRSLMMPLPGERARQRARLAMQPEIWKRTNSARKSGYYNNRLPTVNGNVVFGMRDARMG